MTDMSNSPIGKPLQRREDYRFLTGAGQYTDDVVLPGQTFGYFLRSPHAHARIKSIDTSKAAKAAGVVQIFTGADLAEAKVGGLPCGWLIHSKDGSPMKEPPHPVLAQGKVRHVGDQVALIVAETALQAKDAAELIEVDYEELPAVIEITTADKSASAVHDDVPNNVCYDWGHGNKDAVDAAFKQAAKVSTLEFVNNRLIPNAMEPRAANAQYTKHDDSYTLYVANQNPHVERLLMSAFVLGLPESKVRVIAPDVGGGFGSKIFLYAEETALVWASKRVNRPIKWTAERSESFLTDAHGRDHHTKVELAMDAKGNFLAMRVDTIANMGAYLSTFASSVPTILYATLLAGQYKTPAIYCNVKAVFTTTAPVDAYRGAGRPEATYVVERIVEQAARDMKMDPAALRRQNFITEFPYATPVGLTYDIGNYAAHLDKAIQLADVAGFPARKAASAAKVRVHPTGTVTVFTGSHSHGQGHETTFAQVVAAKLGIPVGSVEIVHGDTGRVPFGMGTYGSRSLSVGGTAIVKAVDKIIAKGKKIAAHLLEASDTDIEFDNGEFKVKGTDKKVPFGSVALTAYVPHNYPLDKLEPGLNENAFYDPTNFTYPSGTYVCEVEVDPDTGKTRVERFTAVDDFGNIVNPMIVSGQVHGGLAQGLGQAMLEGCVYDPESGQLLTGTYMDYTMPRADDLPNFTVDHTVTPCTHNPLGVKGCGEAGAIGSPPAFMNALTDALGVKDLAMPATAERVWRAAHKNA
jgi:carbon-monoxide dehydrogenase large subunit